MSVQIQIVESNATIQIDDLVKIKKVWDKLSDDWSKKFNQPAGFFHYMAGVNVKELSASAIIKALGYTFEVTSSELIIKTYSGQSGYESLFLYTIRDYITGDIHWADDMGDDWYERFGSNDAITTWERNGNV